MRSVWSFEAPHFVIVLRCYSVAHRTKLIRVLIGARHDSRLLHYLLPADQLLLGQDRTKITILTSINPEVPNNFTTITENLVVPRL